MDGRTTTGSGMRTTATTGMLDDAALARLARELIPQGGAATAVTVIGAAGSGKSQLLEAVRGLLRDQGLRVAGHPGAGWDMCDAVVLDDLHRCTDQVLAQVAALAEQQTHVIVAATVPRRASGAFQTALESLRRNRPPLRLEPARQTDILFGLEHGNGPAERGAERVAAHVHGLTGGQRWLLQPALVALRSGARADELGAVTAGLVRERLYPMTADDVAAVALLTLGEPIGIAEVAGCLEVDAPRAAELIDDVRCAGLLTGPDTFRRQVHAGAVAVAGRLQIAAVEEALLGLLRGRGMVTPALLDVLAADGVQAGADDLLIRAEQLLAGGELEAAGSLIGSLAERVTGPQRTHLTDDAATLALLRGDAARAHALYEWLAGIASADDYRPGPRARIAAVAAGHGDTAAPEHDAARAGAPVWLPGPPSPALEAESLTAAGLVESLTQAGAGLHRLMRAAGVAREGEASARPAADTPAATAALLALHLGAHDRARSVLTRAGTELPPLYALRHRLLLTWALLLDGETDAAARETAALAGAPLCRRDEFAFAALQVALARRRGDRGGLAAAFERARDPLAECSIDLFSLLFAGELWVGAAELGCAAQVGELVGQLSRLVAALGPGCPWSTAVHWYGVHAAIATSQPDQLVPHARALAAAAPADPLAAVLATAGRVWVDVLGGRIDHARVEASARALSQAGYAWDGARLAGQAALAADDPRIGAAALQLARALRVRQQTPAQAATGTPRRSATALSEREQEVAALVLQGITYREIGERLYISAKTVEHHVARIRQRLGAQSRAEMLTMLRALSGS